jgi:hypothetical protein
MLGSPSDSPLGADLNQIAREKLAAAITGIQPDSTNSSAQLFPHSEVLLIQNR